MTMSRDEAIERYILLRLRAEDINRQGFLVERLYDRSIRLPNGSPFMHPDLKDTARTLFFGLFATLTDKDPKAVNAFEPLLVLFPHRRIQIDMVRRECEAVHGVLHEFRNNVAFHSRASVAAQIKARRGLRGDDTFLDLESARKDFQRLMADVIAEEVVSVPELPKKLAAFRLSHHPAFANVSLAVDAAAFCVGPAFYDCEVVPRAPERAKPGTQVAAVLSENAARNAAPEAGFVLNRTVMICLLALLLIVGIAVALQARV